MDPGERATGTRDEQYNLISVLYHALHGAETVEAYTLDAEAADDERLAEFFREAQATHRQLAERAKELLGIGGGVEPETAGGATLGTTPLETEPLSNVEPVDVRGRVAPEVGFPPESEATPGSAPGDVPSPSAEVQREPNIPVDEFGVTAEETPLASEILRTPTTTPLPYEDLVAETRGVMPEDIQREAPPAGLAEDVEAAGAPREGASEAPREVPDEPDRATQERQTPDR